MNLDAHDRRVVICDPDRTVLELLQIRLGIAGSQTFVARSGLAALELIRNVRPHAVLLELNLPEMDGFEVLRALNPRGAGLSFPVLVMGKRLGAEEIQRAVSLGARDCLIKPFSGADVLERVARQFRRPTPVPVLAPAAAAARGGQTIMV